MTKQAEVANGQYLTPPVNVIDRKETVILEVELPGVPKDGVELEVRDGELTITGKRAATAETGTKTHIRERRPGSYRRTFTLSRAVDSTRIDAAMNDGVLTVTLPKAEELKPKKIAIK